VPAPYGRPVVMANEEETGRRANRPRHKRSHLGGRHIPPGRRLSAKQSAAASDDAQGACTQPQQDVRWSFVDARPH
jgi:hypothetical protein